MLAAATPDPVAKEDRSGPSRQATCRTDNDPKVRCRFTPLFGDGSFNIELPKGRELRIVVYGERGWLFVPLSPERRARMGGYHRDRNDRACWVADEPKDSALPGPPDKICVYR